MQQQNKKRNKVSLTLIITQLPFSAISICEYYDNNNVVASISFLFKLEPETEKIILQME